MVFKIIYQFFWTIAFEDVFKYNYSREKEEVIYGIYKQKNF